MSELRSAAGLRSLRLAARFACTSLRARFAQLAESLCPAPSGGLSAAS